MTTPTFADGPPVPLMVQGVLDTAQLDRLFDELAATATVQEIRAKAGPVAYTPGDTLTPADARNGLLAGTFHAVQVRYRFADQDWTDTILSMPTGYRVVRCRHEPG